MENIKYKNNHLLNLLFEKFLLKEKLATILGRKYIHIDSKLYTD